MSVGRLSVLIAAAQVLSAAGTRPINEANSIFAIYHRDWGLAPSGGDKLLFVAWPDGQVVWSEDLLEGGAPFRTGKVAPERMVAMFERFERDGLFRDKRLARPQFGPDSRFTTLLIKHGSQKLEMNSWHEVAERHPGTVGVAAGLIPLPKGATRLSTLSQEPTEYLFYRLVWGELRILAAALMPTESTPTNGEAVWLHGVYSWQEGHDK